MKTKNIKNKIFVLLLILSFTALAGLESVLHNHDFDLEEVHRDCAPCLWKQGNSQIDSGTPDLTFFSFIQSFNFTYNPLFIFNTSFTFTSRSPPLFS
ncbi:MAG: hypothetical protein H8E32_14165 [Nitrospinae bacterium]|nr:hypothetical protein [Nitrospinota bacterium]